MATGIKQQSQVRRRKNRMRHYRRSVMSVGIVLVLLVLVVSFGSISLRKKNSELKVQEAKLQEQLQAEKERTEEIEELKQYVMTDEYAKKIAEEKLGLAKENEILFRSQ